MGIEPTQSAWKAEVLPLNYTRLKLRAHNAKTHPKDTAAPDRRIPSSNLVEGGGFEPPKAEPSDLQSDPFSRSGTPPRTKRGILGEAPQAVNSA